ncbi:MAG: ABC transporter ATP-binding protein [Brachybacterium sp.]|uniref:ABC transporter ATP-binding protein n=1 Tax=Microbacterium TaxID=33882 RepID=UPI003F96385A
MIRQLRAVLGPEHRGAYTRFLVWATLYGVLQGLSVSLLLPIARALAASEWESVWRWLGALAIGAVLCAIAQYQQALRGFNVALILMRTMHLNVGDHLVKLPLGWFSGKIGSVSQVAAKGTLAVGSAAAHLMTPVVIGIAAPATVTVCMLFLDWRIGIALVLAAPLIAATSRFAARMIARSEQTTHAAATEVSDRVIEFARCQPVLRAFGRTRGNGYRPLADALEAQDRAVRRSLVESVAGIAVGGIAIQLVFTALVILAAVLALGGTLSGIDLLALLGIASRFIQPLGEVGEYGGPIRQARGELTRIQEILDARPLPDPQVSAPLTDPGRVELDRVSFGYEPGTPVLDDVSFTVPPRTMTALVGPSGSGKTTITRLIARFTDTDAGAVRVGGTDVREQTTEDLMCQLALVFQDVYLFDDTLRENIRIGDPDATEQQLDEAARLAGVTEIAERLPDGWASRVGEAGSALSGGERQRVSIARALLKRAPVVLLDEATAALDPENERFVQRTLEALRESSTLLVIAHKLSTVTRADQIIVLDEHGHVAETGTHEELLSLGGRYAAFWNERTAAAGWRLLPEAGTPAAGTVDAEQEGIRS